MLFSSDDQPSLGYHFRVDFIFPLPNRTIETKFREVSGMDRTIVMETDSIGENKVPFFAPVSVKYGTLSLKRGMLPGSYLIDWVNLSIITQRRIPIPVVVSTLDHNHMPLYCWVFFNVYPTKFATSGLHAQEAGILVEEIELQYSSFMPIRVQGGLLEAAVSQFL
jgi:phage tail-like protein